MVADLSPFHLELRPPPATTLFPYTTLFRSVRGRNVGTVLGWARCCSASPSCSASRTPRRSRSGFRDRKSTGLNSSHVEISYAVFCLKKKSDTQTAASHHSPSLPVA